MRREVTPTESAILDMLHQVQQNQEAEMETTARRALEREFEQDADTSFPKILLTDALNLHAVITNAYQPFEREKKRRNRVHRLESVHRQPLDYHKLVLQGMRNDIFSGALRRRRMTRFLATPIVLKTQPESVDIASKTEARISFGWQFQIDRSPGQADVLAALNIFKIVTDENSGHAKPENMYGIIVRRDAGKQKVELESAELEAYIGALENGFKKEHGARAQFDRSTVLVPDEFCYQPIGLIEQGLQELSSMHWKARARPYPVVE